VGEEPSARGENSKREEMARKDHLSRKLGRDVSRTELRNLCRFGRALEAHSKRISPLVCYIMFI